MPTYTTLSPLILCIDDDSVGLSMRSAILAQHGYRVLVAYNGEEALQLAERYPVDGVVTDFKMPGMDGLETAQKLRSMLPQLPILMLAGAELPLSMQGIDGFVSKASDASLLLNALRDMLSTHAQRPTRDESR
jgi:CheY-like chemotaxis protein